jgi:hypothetical protein
MGVILCGGNIDRDLCVRILEETKWEPGLV